MARNASLALAIGVALVAGYAAFAAKDWQWKAALFPLAIGVPLCCLAVIEVVLSFLDKRSTEQPAPRGSALPWAWMGGFLALIVLLGFPIAVAVFVFGYLKLQSKEGWVMASFYTAVLWAAFYTLFDYLLHLPFPAGWLLAWLGLA